MKTLNPVRLVLTALSTTIPAIVLSGGTLFAHPGAPVGLTVHPGAAAPIVMNTLPNAACTLRPAGSRDVTHLLNMNADQAGVIVRTVSNRYPTDRLTDEHVHGVAPQFNWWCFMKCLQNGGNVDDCGILCSGRPVVQ